MHAIQIEVGHFQQEMHQTTRSGEDNVGVLLQYFKLRLDRLAAHDDARLKRGEVGQLLAHVVRLVRQLTRGRKHDTTHPRGTLPLLQLFDERNDERRRLTTSYTMTTGKEAPHLFSPLPPHPFPSVQ